MVFVAVQFALCAYKTLAQSFINLTVPVVVSVYAASIAVVVTHIQNHCLSALAAHCNLALNFIRIFFQAENLYFESAQFQGKEVYNSA